jgi:two-component system response regulator
MTADGIEILLVEDHAADAELTLRALRNANVTNRIHLARDGAEALAFLQGGNRIPRLVLLDLKMPKLDGLEVLRRMRDDPRTKLVPVVILTSSREEPDIHRAYELGANSYIVKPVDFEGFANAVTDVGLYWMVLNQPAQPDA